MIEQNLKGFNIQVTSNVPSEEALKSFRKKLLELQQLPTKSKVDNTEHKKIAID